MRFIFIVQGEGRGHMTQAIAMYQILTAKGHEVTDIVIGSSDRRKVPHYVSEQINSKIHALASPNFVTDAKGKSINIWKTILRNALKSNSFVKSMRQLDALVQAQKPDVVLNFYDFLGGVWHGLHRPALKFVVVGHQYLIAHPDFPFAKNSGMGKLLLKLGTAITAWGAHEHIALSFRELPAMEQKPEIKIWPPILREQLTKLKPSNGDYFLAYLVNPGYGEELLRFAEAHPDIQIQAFWDQKGKPDPWQPMPNLVFFQLNGDLFLQKMAECRALVSTAGFEAICEAMYLGKPALMVPVEGQYEQACNALDGEIAGAGLAGSSFDIQELIVFMNKAGTKKNYEFHLWYSKRDALVEVWLYELSQGVSRVKQLQA
ncbi:glycosyltransferase family protein [Pleomorphovibrio marinus]|uniref:glycosyltransferase family protein n=1 Tax=Pleomorphovibrio marinus TaxID=2164132 RepID=UPI000E0C1E77|nr:glycosyltransferase family protein [Pleomorphovibrio marinus]